MDTVSSCVKHNGKWCILNAVIDGKHCGSKCSELEDGKCHLRDEDYNPSQLYADDTGKLVRCEFCCIMFPLYGNHWYLGASK